LITAEKNALVKISKMDVIKKFLGRNSLAFTMR
jgi:hypothetical protein